MKLNRLLEITTILLNKKTITAAELAERFGVSIRTIYRDIDALSSSGIPVYTTQGANGGISILDNYTINRTMLSDKERDSIIFALQTLQSTKYPEVETVIEKLGSIFTQNNTDWISIDFSPWGSNPNAYHRFSDIKTAIIQSRIIEIHYINTNNKKSVRKIEPLRLIFKSQAWYLWGYCELRNDYRTFRISRIKKVVVSDETFDRRNIHNIDDIDNKQQQINEPRIAHLILEFTSDALYRLYDDYDYDEIEDNGNGTYTLKIDIPEDEWVYGYILSFGTFVKVIEPLHIKDIIKERIKNMNGFYE